MAATLPFQHLPLVNSNFFGDTGFVIDKPGDLTTDIYGLSTCTMTAKCSTDKPGQIPDMFTPHPLYPFCHLERRRVNIESGYYVFTGEYAGIPNPPGISTPIYELCLGLAEEPIESHPNFYGGIAGTPSAPANGAVWIDYETQKATTDDSRGIFAGFIGTSKAGVTSYLEMGQAVWRQRYVAVSPPPDITFVGHVEFPAGPVPGIPGNWLYAGVQYEQRGLCFTVSQEWRASGRRSWDADIYGF